MSLGKSSLAATAMIIGIFGLLGTAASASEHSLATPQLAIDCVANSSPHFVNVHFELQGDGTPHSVTYIDNTPHSMDTSRVVDFRNQAGELYLKFYDQYLATGELSGYVLKVSGDQQGLENGAIYSGNVYRFKTSTSTGRTDASPALAISCQGTL